MAIQMKALLVAAMFLTSISFTLLYLFKLKENERQVRERMQKLLKTDDTLAFIVESGNLELLIDYYDEDLESVGLLHEDLEKLMEECVRNRRSPEQRRIEVIRSNREAIEKYERSKVDRDGIEVKKSVPLNAKNVRFENDKDKELKEA